MAEVAPLSGSQLSTAASEFQQLRTINGHFSGGEWNADVDGFGGRKRELMSILKALVGVQGTPFAQVFEAMGAPDVVIPNPSNEAPAATTDLLRTEPTIPTMPGPFLPNSPASVQNESLFLIYYWRGRKDYLWFWIDSDGNVVKSEWHSDFE
ncbi:hypothetical protein BJ742DRAFT_741573 [Cladochytrium replicatum]|nr:hypothetical protein BJ742DRAFT_741573 [Cladochytrium replicatum]